MSYVTVEVEIDHGRIVARGSEALPEKGSGLLTILQPERATPAAQRPYGLARGSFRVPPDFNAPLPEQVLREFEGA
jgi:hypothetical protein